MSFSHITKYDAHTFMGYTNHTPALPIMHFISLFKNSINLIKLCLLNLIFVLMVQKPNSLYIFWSAASAFTSFLCFIKYNNPYFHKGMHSPHLLLPYCI